MKRNPFCPYYDKCLNKTVQQDLPDFTCSGCEHENKKKKMRVQDIWGSCLLISKLFLPDAYQEYIKEKHGD